MRYTEYHAGKAVIKDKNKLSEAMEKLARLEATYWYHLKTPQCRISQDTKKMTEKTISSIREMMKKPMHIMAWL